MPDIDSCLALQVYRSAEWLQRKNALAATKQHGLTTRGWGIAAGRWIAERRMAQDTQSRLDAAQAAGSEVRDDG